MYTMYIVILVIEYAEILIVLLGTSLPHDFIFSAQVFVVIWWYVYIVSCHRIRRNFDHFW